MKGPLKTSYTRWKNWVLKSVYIKCPEEANPRESGCGQVAAGAREGAKGPAIL